MADLPAAPNLWLDFSQGYVNGATNVFQNLGHIGGTWSASGGSWKPTICGGVWDLENTTINTGNSVVLDAGASNATYDAFNLQNGTVDYTMTLGFAYTGAFTAKQSFTYILASNTFRVQLYNNVNGLQVGNGYTSGTVSSLVDNRFYIWVVTNSYNDGFTRVRIYDTVSDTYVYNNNFGNISTFNRTPVSKDYFNTPPRIARFGSSWTGSYSAPAYIGHFTHWAQGMTSTQMDSVVDYYKHKYAPRVTITSGGGGGGGSASYTDIESANYGVTLQQHNHTTTSDYTGGYYTTDVQVQGVTSKYLYVGFKNTASTNYYGDLPIAHIQILQSNGTSFRTGTLSGATRAYDFTFGTGGTLGYQLWRYSSTSTSSDLASSTNDPAALAYSSLLTTGAVAGRWTVATGTTSSYVGAADGIYSSAGYAGVTQSTSGGNILPANSVAGVSQSPSTSYYAYVECSGFATGSGTWIRSYYQLTVQDGDIIRICYVYPFPNSRSDGLQDLSGTLFLRFK